MQSINITAADVDATFDAIFDRYVSEASAEFSADEVSASFSRAGVVVEVAVEKHFESSCAGDDDWSMV